MPQPRQLPQTRQLPKIRQLPQTRQLPRIPITADLPIAGIRQSLIRQLPLIRRVFPLFRGPLISHCVRFRFLSLIFERHITLPPSFVRGMVGTGILYQTGPLMSKLAAGECRILFGEGSIVACVNIKGMRVLVRTIDAGFDCIIKVCAWSAPHGVQTRSLRLDCAVQ